MDDNRGSMNTYKQEDCLRKGKATADNTANMVWCLRRKDKCPSMNFGYHFGVLCDEKKPEKKEEAKK